MLMKYNFKSPKSMERYTEFIDWKSPQNMLILLKLIFRFNYFLPKF